MVIRFIDYLQVVTTNNNNTIVDFHITNHSTLSLLIPLHSNGRRAHLIENSLSIVDACLPQTYLPNRCLKRFA
jgi:hypothetical protein